MVVPQKIKMHFPVPKGYPSSPEGKHIKKMPKIVIFL
jgi:hypothetical protein